MIRVLHVFGCLNRGGAETAIMNYYRKIDRTMVQFDFVTHFGEVGAYEEEILKLGGRIFRVPRFKGYNIASYLLAWRRLLLEHREWRTIHIHIFTISGVILPIAKMCGIPRRIVHCHSTSSPIFDPFTKLANRVFRLLANKLSTHRYACSDDAGRYYFSHRSFRVINNAIDAKKFTLNTEMRSDIREQFSIADCFVVGHVGRFNTPKNHPFTIDIFSELYKRDNNSRLMLVGAGSPVKEQIEAKVDSLGLSEAVIFTGVRGDIPDLMQAMDIFIFPSLWEGLGIVAIEAQAASLTTIVSDAVPDAAMITPLAKKLELSRGAEYWAEKILSYRDQAMSRRDTYDQIRAAGYDIDDNVKWLQDFYVDESK
ncbi:MAG: glycosyltransferase family 1 protein [Rikenellaceae bacterium]